MYQDYLQNNIYIKKNQNVDVDDVDAEFQVQHELQKLSNDLMAGTRAMQKSNYIAKAKLETDEEYNARINGGYLSGVFKKTVKFLVGQVFQKNITTENDIEEEFYNDVDNQGNDITQWARDVFENGIVDGVTFALVEHSSVRTRKNENGTLEYLVGKDEQGEEVWNVKNLQADKNNNWRPYFVHIPAKQVLSCWVRNENGKNTITMFRYKEFDYIPVAGGKGFDRELVERVRVYKEGGFYEVHEKKDGQTSYKLVESGKLSIDEIPLCIFQVGEKMTKTTAIPTLEDLAQIALRHYKSTVNFFHLNEFNDRPVWFGRNITGQMQYDEATREYKTAEFAFGAGMLIVSNSADSSLESVGIDSASVANARETLAKLEEEMSTYGLQLLKPKVQMTATEADINNEENNSTLKSWALEFEDFLENVNYFLGLWLKKEMPKLTVNKEFSQPMSKDFIVNLQRSGLISKKTALEILKQIGELPDTLIVEEEIQQAGNESNLTGTAGRGFFNTGA